jgi:hypothetical protein
VLGACNSVTQQTVPVLHPTPVTSPSDAHVESSPTVAPTETISVAATGTAGIEATGTLPPTAELAPVKIVTSLAEIAQADVVADGQQGDYAKRILAAYANKEIPNFDPTIPFLPLGDVTKNPILFDQEGSAAAVMIPVGGYGEGRRPNIGATMVSDGGAGGVRIAQLWWQKKDGVPGVGVAWYHFTAEYVHANPTALRKIVTIMFEVKPDSYMVPAAYKDVHGCESNRGLTTGIETFCTAYMQPDAVALRAKLAEE